MAKDEVKLVVVTLPTQAQQGKYLDLRGLTIKGDGDIQDLCLASGVPLITTAHGVAPTPALQYKCLWLLNILPDGRQVKWRIEGLLYGYQVLIPEVIAPEAAPDVDVDEEEDEE